MNHLMKIRNCLIAAFTAFIVEAGIAQDYIPYHYEQVSETLGPIDGNSSMPAGLIRNALPDDMRNYVVISKVITVSGSAAWFRLHFNNVNLGQHSFITITSLADGGMQKLNSNTIETWGFGSALFNGTQVQIKLYAAPNDQNVFININQLLVGDVLNNSPESQCGPQDNRVATTDGAAGRLMPVGCTGWLIPNGNFLTAGHCCATLTSINIIEFNVPASNSNGTTVAADPDDQYPVIDASVTNQNAGVGDDWCVFSVGVNSNTGKTPVEKNGVIGVLDYSFFRVTHDNIPVTARVTGYGTDNVPPGSGGGNNSSSQTEQTHSGPFVGETTTSANDISLGYTIDTEGGNSGSPVFIDGTRNAIGIHTNGGCNTSGTPGNNSGTSFEADDTENAIVNSTAAINKYVDENHPTTSAATGTVFRPYKTVNAGITAIAAGDVLNIAEGSYAETVVTSKTQVWRAPVGLAIIGPNAPATPAMTNSASAKNTGKNTPYEEVIINAIPNPASDFCYVELKLQTKAPVSIFLNNLVGQTVITLTEGYLKMTNQKIKVDMSNLKEGVYMLIVRSGDKEYVKKIVKI